MYKIEYENIKNFLLGGKCDFILINKTTKHHIGFSIKLITKSNTKPNRYYVYYNSTSPTYIGWLNEDGSWLGIYTNIEEQYLKQQSIFHKLHNYIFKEDKYPNNIEIHYTGQCSKCGRILKDPKSIKLGIGKYCLENME